MKRAYLVIVLASVSLAMPTVAVAHDDDPVTDIEHVDHDAQTVTHDAESVDRDAQDVERAGKDIDKADHETDSLFEDSESDIGLVDDHPHDDANDDANDDQSDDPLNDERDAEKAECDRLHFEYLLRHPPGTKPSGLRGLHGCALWRADARWHDEHPDVISILGDNIFIGPRI